ncbi:MAG: TIGR04211 family SH3 domain-containing protein [Pseudomonadota bacterium]
MKHFIFIGVWLVIFSAAVRAETMYVSDLTEITLRTGQGIDHKIIAMIQSGQQVEILEAADQWTKIRLPDGREGWVVSRFLSSKLPCSMELEELKKKHEGLLSLTNSPYKEMAKFQEETRKLKTELAVSEKTLNELKTAYETLKNKSPGLSTLQADYQRVVAELGQQKNGAEKLEEKLSKVEMRQHIRWFISGAVVLFVGFLMGFNAKRQRRRSSLL